MLQFKGVMRGDEGRLQEWRKNRFTRNRGQERKASGVEAVKGGSLLSDCSFRTRKTRLGEGI